MAGCGAAMAATNGRVTWAESEASIRSVAAVVAEIVAGAGERGDGVETAGRRWDEPTPKPMPEVNGSIAVIRSLDEVGADDFGAGEAVESGAVEAGSRLREAGKEVGVVV